MQAEQLLTRYSTCHQSLQLQIEENPFEKAVEALMNYFTPQKKKQEFEIYVFLHAKQESLDNYWSP